MGAARQSKSGTSSTWTEGRGAAGKKVLARRACSAYLRVGVWGTLVQGGPDLVCAMRAAAWCSRLAEERVRGGAHVCFERPSVVADDREVQRGDGVCTRWVAVRGWCPLLAMGHAMMGVWSVVKANPGRRQAKRRSSNASDDVGLSVRGSHRACAPSRESLAPTPLG
jgi:hypothetical protein